MMNKDGKNLIKFRILNNLRIKSLLEMMIGWSLEIIISLKH